MGKELFPLLRHDHTLFTWPILAAVLFLIIKVDTWNLVRNQFGNGVHLKTAIALGITGVAWTFLGIYRRGNRDAVAGVHLGWIWIFAGVHFGYWAEAHAPHWTWPFLITGLLLQALYWLYRFRLEKIYPWAKSLLTEPTRLVLLGSSAALAIACILCLLEGAALERMQWLSFFVACQLVWHALATRKHVFGTILFFHIWVALLALTSGGTNHLLERVGVENSLTPTLWLFLIVQLLLIAIEGLQSLRKPKHIYQRLAPLLSPSLAIASFVIIVLGLAGIMDGVHWLTLSAIQQALLLIAL